MPDASAAYETREEGMKTNETATTTPAMTLWQKLARIAIISDVRRDVPEESQERTALRELYQKQLAHIRSVAKQEATQ